MQNISKIILYFILTCNSTYARHLAPEQYLLRQYSGIEARVIGGSDVPENLLTYQVSIQNVFGEMVCGGAIIASEWILTAGHCMDWPKEYLKVVTGTINWTKPDAEYSIIKVKRHTLYNKPMYHNDIALLKLAKPLVYNERTQPVELQKTNELKEGHRLILSGWGSIKAWGRATDILKQVELHYLPYDKCIAEVPNAKWMGEGNICTDTKNSKGSCNGDSGGPLYDANNRLLVGIVNWGQPCAVGFPDVFASVAYYYDWIQNSMNEGEEWVY